MTVAVGGGGLFGSTAAVELARAGHRVDLYERHPGILNGASRANQGRLHMGYHYPRSADTALACQGGARQFRERWPDVITDSGRRYYAVAGDGLTSAEQFEAHCDLMRLPCRPANPPFAINRSARWYAVAEQAIDLPALRAQLWIDLRKAGVQTHLGREVRLDQLDHDLIVDATYGRYWPGPLRYEVCETVLVKLGKHLDDASVVVLDGPFVSLDPVPGTDLHMLYDVTHSVHHATDDPGDVPPPLASLLDRGVLRTRHTRVGRMEQTLRRFIAGVGMPEYRGSMFTLRAVLPDVDATDARPTLVRRAGNRISVLSGKLDTCLAAARTVVDLARQAVPVG